MFDAHHPAPLAVGKRVTLPEHLQILCPTCHRRAHRKGRVQPFSLLELQAWVRAGRP
jgi:5-methylcytosine-specific restriction enzyme A